MPPTDYAARIAVLHRELGNPGDYAQSRALTLQSEAEEAALVKVAQNEDGRAVRMIPPAAAGWRQMHLAATAVGVTLQPLSGFRSVTRQAKLIRTKIAAGQNLPTILSSIAAPGYSEHHTGRALDLGTPGEPSLVEGFAHTPAYAWLCAHAASHGFQLSYPRGNQHGIIYEPWHWYWAG
jgi:D-alanyl-D-alanine carboxypeptidase